MQLNQKKTKQIVFNFNRGKQFTTEIQLKQDPLEKYLVNSSKTRRYADSAVPFLQRMLNKDDFGKRKNLKRLMDFESSMSSGKRQSLKQKKLVNYVSNVDVIT